MRSTILPSRHGQARVDHVVLGDHVVYARVEVSEATASRRVTQPWVTPTQISL
jgi:hypothetical protein